jgi:hypothetical protein
MEFSQYYKSDAKEYLADLYEKLNTLKNRISILFVK